MVAQGKKLSESEHSWWFWQL